MSSAFLVLDRVVDGLSKAVRLACLGAGDDLGAPRREAAVQGGVYP